jgi:GNAT superfamily N-acetyltransferase
VTVRVRKIEERDEPRWRELFDGYTRFYEREPSEDLKRHIWDRIQDFASPIHAIVAEREGEGVIGFANYVIHESTGATVPVCYLQDLFVDPAKRGEGVGRRLIDWMVAETKRQGWARLYWNTREDNYRARALYDTYTRHSGFVRYVIAER